jgi:hypothetical protein
MMHSVSKSQARFSGWQLVLLAGVVAFLVGLGVQPVAAGTAVGNNNYYSSGGRSYVNYSTVRTPSAIATVSAGPTVASAPVGYVGVQGRLYRNSAVHCTGLTDYNSVALGAGAFWNGQSCLTSLAGTYFSRGYSFAYTSGGSYSSHLSLASPNQVQ